MKFNRLFLTSILTFLLLFLGACGNTDNANESTDTNENKTEEVEVKDLILSTTTSTQDSGLLDVLIPIFEEQNKDINVKTIAVGTGQALEMGTKGEADVLLVHAPASEQKLVDNGDAINYQLVMHNDFIIVGPKDDPAGIKGLPVTEAFEKLYNEKAVFVTRGDDSGTNKKELAIWKEAGITPEADSESYPSTGQGMGATLQVANEKGGYTLTDRATFLAQEKNLTNLQIVVEGDEVLLNIYHVMQVNPEKNDMINGEGAEKFVEFMINADTQAVIEEFGVEEYGQPLFFPDAE